MGRAPLGIVLGFVGSVGLTLGFVAGGGGVVGAPRAPFGFGGPSASFADIVERVNPAVVHVDVIETARHNPHEGIEEAPELDLPRRGEGSGFIVDPRGYILTNHHLVPGPARIRVRLSDKRELPARLVGSDASTDLALLKVEADGLPTAPLGDSDRLRVGDWVCAIGNPLHFDRTVTVGVVSSKGRKIFDESFDSYIQTDAAINPGNSGGPLLNLAGEVVGINAAVSSEGQGIGFAVPINVARAILDQLRETGRVSRGYLGIQLQELEPGLQELIGLSEARGAMVLDVFAGGAGEAAGLERYDVIVAVSGQPIQDGDQLVRTIAALRPGSDVVLGVVRDGAPLSVRARLAERAEDDDDAAAHPVPTPTPRAPGDALGLVVAEPSPRVRATLQRGRVGVVVREIVGIDPGIDALAEGDVIVEVNRRPTPDLESYRRVLEGLAPGESAWLFVQRPRPSQAFLAKVEVEAR
jgi:serine protease Do